MSKEILDRKEQTNAEEILNGAEQANWLEILIP